MQDYFIFEPKNVANGFRESLNSRFLLIIHAYTDY